MPKAREAKRSFQSAMTISLVLHGLVAAVIWGLVGGVESPKSDASLQISLLSAAAQSDADAKEMSQGAQIDQSELDKKNKTIRATKYSVEENLFAKKSPSEKSKQVISTEKDMPLEQHTTQTDLMANEASNSNSKDQAQLPAIASPSAGGKQAGRVVKASDAVADSAWLQIQVLDWLDQHKTYPRAAKRVGIEGVVQVRFSVDQDGRLEASGLEKTSGHAILDQAALALIKRATPFPISLRDFGLDRIEFSLPIVYQLSAVVNG